MVRSLAAHGRRRIARTQLAAPRLAETASAGWLVASGKLVAGDVGGATVLLRGDLIASGKTLQSAASAGAAGDGISGRLRPIMRELALPRALGA